jgi:hypothetical protein
VPLQNKGQKRVEAASLVRLLRKMGIKLSNSGAKGCGVEPYCWLVYVLKRLPLAQTADDYEKLLPWNIHPEHLAIDFNS